MEERLQELRQELDSAVQEIKDLRERLTTLRHEYQSDRKSVMMAAGIFAVLTAAFFGLSFQRIGEVVDEAGVKAAVEKAEQAAARAQEIAKQLESNVDSVKKDASAARAAISNQKTNIEEMARDIEKTLAGATRFAEKHESDLRTNTSRILEEYRVKMGSRIESLNDSPILACILNPNDTVTCRIPPYKEALDLLCLECLQRGGKISSD